MGLFTEFLLSNNRIRNKIFCPNVFCAYCFFLLKFTEKLDFFVIHPDRLCTYVLFLFGKTADCTNAKAFVLCETGALTAILIIIIFILY